MKENYMVVQLPKQDGEANAFLQEPELFQSYDDAFARINSIMAQAKQQFFEKPVFIKPVRIALHDRDIELWIIRRKETLLT
jgi:hypothetical protein